MNESRSTSQHSQGYLNILFVIAVAIAAAGAVRYVSYRNMQTQTRREIQKTEDRITALYQDEVPSLQAEIDQRLIRYDMREKLRAQGSTLKPTPAERRELINLQNVTSTTP